MRPQVVVAQAALLGAARLQRMDHDVVGPQQLPQQGLAGGMVQVQRQAALAPVQRGIGRRQAFAQLGRPVARVVAGAWTLDLHDLGTKVGEDLRAVGAGDVLGQVDDPLSGKRLHGV